MTYRNREPDIDTPSFRLWRAKADEQEPEVCSLLAAATKVAQVCQCWHYTTTRLTREGGLYRPPLGLLSASTMLGRLRLPLL